MSNTKAKDFLIEKGFGGFANHSLVPRWMDEYAKRQSIAFQKWVQKNAYKIDGSENYRYVDNTGAYEYPLEDLYSLFLQNTNQCKN